MNQFTVGSLVRCREREWVVLPPASDQPDLLLLRPLGGAEAEVCGIYLPIEGAGVTAATFPPPDPSAAGDAVAGSLLRDAARLTLRSGAGPFRSLGRLGVRPRPYQLVPLIMALRLEWVRLLIADDVGIGKTIEAALIARELFDRGEIRRFTVLCPPHLCDQWQRELREKFGFDAVVVRSSTVGALERAMPAGDRSLWEHYPFTVASIDYVKGERRRATFLRAAPELVIVDEAHTATDGGGRGAAQQRYELVRDLAAAGERHLLLLTATPHSGIDAAFQSLLGLLDRRFAALDLALLVDRDRDALARHFVQRRRADIRSWLGDTNFPERVAEELTYRMRAAPDHQRLLDDIIGFTRAMVRDVSAPGTSAVRQRATYWAALALLRCVASSPAAAAKALRVRADNQDGDFEADLTDDQLAAYVSDPNEQEQIQDLEPLAVVEQVSQPSDRAQLLRFAARATALEGKGDPKLQTLIGRLAALLLAGANPIVFCRYIATANYLARELEGKLKVTGGELRLLAVTGERSEEEREQLIDELARSPRRVLIATDCLSEGINLQHAFDAVLHYDLPWNPNRLEQREGRVDRYGQRAAQVHAITLHSADNLVDEAVMDVLLRKAKTIHRQLGISVPLPVSDRTVAEALLSRLFRSVARAEQQTLDLFGDDDGQLGDADAQLGAIERSWDAAVERERVSRTRFAQRAIKPAEVAEALSESDAVLGDAATVAAFVQRSAERLNAPLTAARLPRTPETPDGLDAFRLVPASLPEPVRERIASLASKRGEVLLSFDELAPPSVERIGRNHPLTAALAEYLLETALAPANGVFADAAPVAARCGASVTDAVTRRTVLLLLRVRMLIESQRQHAPSLAEQLVVAGYTLMRGEAQWLAEPEALALLRDATPRANLRADERSAYVAAALTELPGHGPALQQLADDRAAQLRDEHLRVREQTRGARVTVRPAGPPDLLGVYVLLPPV